MSGQSAPRIARSAATEAWSRRVRRVGGLIQLAFAAFWLVRGSLTIGGARGVAMAAVSVAIAVGLTGYGLRATAGTAPRPHGPDAVRIERNITIATVVQLLASFAAPAAVLAIGRPSWVLPSIAITVGPLLLWLDRQVDVPRYRPAGWALTLGPVVLAIVMSGTALTATTGLGAGLLLLGTAVAGFRDLSALRPASPGDRG